MSSTADIQKRWQIRGTYPGGRKLAFPVMAYDYFEAKKKAEAKLKTGQTITDIVLIEPRRKLV